MKILIMTPFWKRPEIVREYVKSIERLKERANDFSFVHCPHSISFDIQLLGILSPEDTCFGEILDALPDDALVVLKENTPFGVKKNYGLRTADIMDWDYLFELNSDSIVNPELFDLYRPYMEKQVPFFGLKDLFVVDYATKETLSIPDYNSGMTYGAGRMLHRSVFETKLWTNELNEGMDDNMRKRLEKRGIADVPIATPEPMLVELKTNTTINHFIMLKQLGKRNEPKAQVIPYETVKHLL